MVDNIGAAPRKGRDPKKTALVPWPIYRTDNGCCFVIETSFRPHSTEEQKIITIAAVVHDDFHDAPIESRVFFLHPSYNHTSTGTYVPDTAKILCICNEQLRGCGAAVPSVVVDLFACESDLLTAFLQYVKQSRPATITHFNGAAFDLTFLFT
jgi:DNA polymerase elongation subunit (family B)